MIEPQNTTMPLPAAPAQSDSPSPDGVGFGDMLAQSLGMAVDPAAIQQIVGEPNENPFGGGNADLSEGDPGDAAEELAAVTTRYAGLVPEPVVVDNDALPVVPKPSLVDREIPVQKQVPAVVPANSDVAAPVPAVVPANSDVAAPAPAVVPANSDVAAPAPAAPFEPVAIVDLKDGLGKPVLNAAPAPQRSNDALPAQPIAQKVVVDTEPVDGIGVPVLTSNADPADPDVDPVNQQPTGPPAGSEPIATRSGDIVDASKTPMLPTQPRPTAEQPDVVDPAVSGDPGQAAPRFSGAELVAAQHEPVVPRPAKDRRLPVTPELTSVANQPGSRDVEAPPHTVPMAAARIDMGPITQLEVTTPKTAVRIGEPLVVEQQASAPTVPAGNTDAANGPNSVSTQPSAAPTLAAPSMQTALAERVMRAVELQANQPPPRTMVVDIPEIEGLRLIVSVRGGAQVHVVPTTGSATPDSFQPFMDELSGVLSDRGFEMTGEDRQQGRNQHDPSQEAIPFRLQRPTFRRPHPTDNDLRI